MDFLIEAMCAGILQLLNSIFEWYNLFVGMAVGLLGQDPAAWSRQGWNFVTSVNTVFAGVGATLVVIFFLIGFCSESLDFKQDIRLENILRMFIKISIAEYFVANTLKLVKAFFGFGTGLINAITKSGTSSEYKVAEEVSAVLKDPLNHGITGLGNALMLIILVVIALVMLLIICGCGMLILYEAFSRFFKIMMLVPYGALANSTLAGSHMISQSAVSFWKYALGTILEAVTMYIALVLSAVIVKSGTINLAGNAEGIFYIIGWMVQSIFICLITVGSVKSAGTLTHRVLGL